MGLWQVIFKWMKSPIIRLSLVVVIASALLASSPTYAQSIRDDVKKHVDDSLEKEKAKTKKKKDKKKKDQQKSNKNKSSSQKKPQNKQRQSSSDDNMVVIYDSNAPPKEQIGPQLPRRVIHKWFKFDLEAGVGYRAWAPQQYPTVSVDMAHYFTWSLSVKARLFNLISLRRGYYETSKPVSPRASYADDAASYSSIGLKAAAWLLAEIGIPILKTWEPTIRYEARNFGTSARQKGTGDLCVVPFGSDADALECQSTAEHLNVVSSSETIAVGVRYHASKDPNSVIHHRKSKAPPFFFGLAYTSYIKPYQVSIGENVLDEYLFTGRFYGGGLALGTELGGGVNNFYFDIWTQFGLGAVRLTKDMTLNELAPEDWLIGYIQGNAKLSYRWCPFKFAPSILIVPSGTSSGASFFFFETQVEEGEDMTISTVNWDVLYTVRLSLIVTL